MPTFCTTDSGPSFRNTFAEKAVKLGVRLEHNSAYNPGSQTAVKTGVGRLKHLLKICGLLTQLQIHKVFFCMNICIQPGNTGSPLARFLGREVRSPEIQNSLNRHLN